MASPLSILFISRAYPPVIGGIERQNFELVRSLSEIADVTLIANTRGKRFLPVFFIAAFIRGIWHARNVDVVLLGDAVLAPLGLVLGKCCSKPVACIVHGLDITYSNRFYQTVWVKWGCARLTRLFAVGNETIRQIEKRGIASELCQFIPNGVSVKVREATVESAPRINLTSKKFHVLTLGRLIERKGVLWFLEHVMPRLSNEVHYWIAGTGPCLEGVQKCIIRCGLVDRVTILGEVSELEKSTLFSGVDLFVQPNVPVPNDIEGFGLVVLEAAVAGVPVVASCIQGLQDAISDGENGVLLPPQNAEAFVSTIEAFVHNPEKAKFFGKSAQAFTKRHCRWEDIAQRYILSLREMLI